MLKSRRLFKAVIAILAVSVLTAPLCASAEETDIKQNTEKNAAVYYIREAEDMLSLADDPYGNYTLCENIDMAGIDWTPVEFYGSFDGNGYSIINLNVSNVSDDTMLTFDGNMSRYNDTHFAALFSIANDAEIRNLTMLGVNVDVAASYDCYCAMLAGYAVDTVVENCTFDGSVKLAGSGNIAGVGGVIGFGDTDIKNCSVTSELIFCDRNEESVKCEMFLGGLVADGLCDTSYNDVDIQGYISTHGYVHSGGLIGMSFRMHFEYVEHTIDHNKVNGSIHFYENNRDRRAYCEALVGEDLFHWAPRVENDTYGFTGDEVFDYSEELLPEMCGEPQYADTVVAPLCDSCGYTVHRCAVCGYEKKDTYTLPEHTPGEVAVQVSPDYESEGLGVISCIDCGAELETVVLDKLVKAGEIELSSYELRLHPGDTAKLEAAVLPENSSCDTCLWVSSDETVVTVDALGNVEAVDRGEAVLNCTSDDGFAAAQCTVRVRLSLGQLIRRYILFGWVSDIKAQNTEQPEQTPAPEPTATVEITPEPTEPPAEQTPEVTVPEYDYEAEQADLRVSDHKSLIDGSMYWMQSIEADTPVKLSSDTAFSRLYIMWHTMPDEWYFSADGESWETAENSPFLHQCYDLPEPVTELYIKVPEDAVICELYAFTEGNYPDWVQQWKILDEAADILMFPTHADDEWCFFSGVVPYYGAELGYNVQVVYMINHVVGDGKYRVHELLNGLWYAGDVYYPEINYAAVDHMFDLYGQAEEFYGSDNFIGFQTEMIRKYQPTVVLGHDFEGEYGHNVHKLNAKCLAKAVEAAADEQQYAESAALYGSWDTPKYYVHLYGDKDGQTYIEAFDKELERFDGRTAMEVAVTALKYHETQVNYSFVRQVGAQDSHVWGLYRSLVGSDVLKNDFFENTAKEAVYE